MSKSGGLWLVPDAGLEIVIWVLGNNRTGGAVSRMLLLSDSAPTLWTLARQERNV